MEKPVEQAANTSSLPPADEQLSPCARLRHMRNAGQQETKRNQTFDRDLHTPFLAGTLAQRQRTHHLPGIPLGYDGKPSLSLHVVVHHELVRMGTETQGVIFFLFHLQPVRDEVGVEDIAFEKERVIAFERGDRATK